MAELFTFFEGSTEHGQAIVSNKTSGTTNNVTMTCVMITLENSSLGCSHLSLLNTIKATA